MKPISLAVFLALAAPLGLAACSSGPPVQTSFPELQYTYLPQITLKVASVSVRDEYLPGPNAAQMIAAAPEAPAAVLERMARERLIGDGSPGAATFTIKRAALEQVGDNLEGTMTVELSVNTSNGQRVGYADATVSRSETAPSNETPDRMRAALYALTKRMMADMNVELQYQIQKSLPDWLAYSPTPGMAPAASTLPPTYNANNGIVAQPLGGSAPATGASPALVGPPAVPGQTLGTMPLPSPQVQ
ncbi:MULTISPECIES: hypothetical protein [Acidiphilium]|uniref:Lipoprotein n=1 Tax=Acidiphilium rubrum TaxID=526 RepID=A0A8G2CIQ9_ACIRU|nr:MULTISPECIES: hypothetical protein [Acidiphilium]MBW4034837.1 hypothetical protein [Pseudomonadota bacterium]SIQ07593.1 hypothetical protein SAMN05421828_101177 [Acidiphilium rubrum]